MKTNDLNIYPIAPVPVTPPAGQTFQDPTFGTTILRVTDEKDSAGLMFANEYSGIYDFANSDSTWISYRDLPSGFRWIAQLDVAKQKVANKRRLTKSGVLYWSRVDPNVLYLLETWAVADLWRYDVAADKWTLIVHLSQLVPAIAIPNTAWVDSRGMSWDDNRFHLSSANSNSVFVYDVKLGKLAGQVTLAQAQKVCPSITDYSFEKSAMDTTGTLIATASNELLVNLITGKVVPGKSDGPSPAGVGDLLGNDVHPDWGPNGMVGGGINIMGAYYPGIRGPVDPNDPLTYLTLRKQLGPRTAWGVDTHSSYRGVDGKWITMTYDGVPTGVDAGLPEVFQQEIWQVSVGSPPDGSVNRRITRHYSDPSTVSADMNYWASPHACMSQDGRVIGWNSTFNNRRIDLYVAFLDGGGEETVTLAGVPFTHAELERIKGLSGILK